MFEYTHCELFELLHTVLLRFGLSYYASMYLRSSGIASRNSTPQGKLLQTLVRNYF